MLRDYLAALELTNRRSLTVASGMSRLLSPEKWCALGVVAPNYTRHDPLPLLLLTKKMHDRFDVVRLRKHIKGGDGGELITAGNQFFQIAGECRRVARDVGD